MVPPYQREYTWGTGDKPGKDQVNRLLQDLSAYVESNEKEYLIGVVTISATGQTVDGLKLNYIVDGQQRTVTMSIFLMCAYEYLSRKYQAQIPIDDAHLFAKLQSLISFNSKSGRTALRVRFSQSQANEALQLIYTWMTSPVTDPNTKQKILSEAPQFSETMINLLEVRRYFSEELERNEWFGGDLLKGLKRIIHEMKLIELEISDSQEALDIYDRMNNRGLPLNSADLIKNQLFVNCSEHDFDEISSNWNDMTTALLDHDSLRFKDPVFLVRSYAGLLWGRPHRENELAKRFEGYFDEAEKPLEFVSELNKLANDSVLLCDKKTLHPLLHAASRLGAVQHFPLVLVGTYLKTPELQSHFFHQVGSRALLQVLSKEHPPHAELIYPKWANEVYKRRDTLSVEELNEIYREFAFKRGDQTIPEVQAYRQELIQNLRNQIDLWSYSLSSQRRKISFALGLISWWIDHIGKAENDFGLYNYLEMKSMDSGNGKKVKWDLDHIAATAYEDPRITTEKKDSIGNLVLLNFKWNRGAGNGEPSSKTEAYSVKASLIFTKLTNFDKIASYKKDLKGLKSLGIAETNPWNLNDWTDASIENRAMFIKSVIEEILLPA